MPWQLSRTSECSLTEKLIQTKVDGMMVSSTLWDMQEPADSARIRGTEYNIHAYIPLWDGEIWRG